MNAVIVPSYKRADLLYEREYSLTWLTAQAKYPIFLAIRQSEHNAYIKVMDKYLERGGNLQFVLIPDADVDNLGETLDWLIQHFHQEGYTKIALYDDDLIFSYREDWNTPKLPRLDPKNMHEALDAQFDLLSEEIPHVCLRHRMFAQNCTTTYDTLKRCMWTHGVHLPTIATNPDLTFSWESTTMTDFHFQLSVVKAGYKNATINGYCADDAVGPYKNEGGCNTYRTDAVRTKSAYALQKKFGSRAVKLREKKTPTGIALDVTVYLSKVNEPEPEPNPFLEGLNV